MPAITPDAQDADPAAGAAAPSAVGPAGVTDDEAPPTAPHSASVPRAGASVPVVTGAESSLNTTAPTKRALLLRQRAARVLERTLPEQVRRAYGVVPIELADLSSGDPQLAEIRESARASLQKQGYLTQDELDTLSSDAAIAVVMDRLRDQSAGLHEQAERQARDERAAPNALGKPPRTVR